MLPNSVPGQPPLCGCPATSRHQLLDTDHAVVYNKCMLLSVLVVAASFDLAAAGAGQAQQSTTPRFERAACPVEVAAGERIDCGVLFVPENRNHVDSRTIRLPVMIFRRPRQQRRGRAAIGPWNPFS
jgi:hypothetical protein